jgi:hypothetical protein
VSAIAEEINGGEQMLIEEKDVCGKLSASNTDESEKGFAG